MSKDSNRQLGGLRKACIAKLNAKEHLITTINKCLTPTKANVESLLVVFFILHMVRFEDNKVQRRHHFPKGWHFGCTSKTRDIKNTPRNMPVLATEIETTEDNLVRIDYFADLAMCDTSKDLRTLEVCSLAVFTRYDVTDDEITKQLKKCLAIWHHNHTNKSKILAQILVEDYQLNEPPEVEATTVDTNATNAKKSKEVKSLSKDSRVTTEDAVENVDGDNSSGKDSDYKPAVNESLFIDLTDNCGDDAVDEVVDNGNIVDLVEENGYNSNNDVNEFGGISNNDNPTDAEELNDNSQQLQITPKQKDLSVTRMTLMTGLSSQASST